MLKQRKTESFISTTQLGYNDAWVYKVQALMRKEIDAKRKDMVIEISK